MIFSAQLTHSLLPNRYQSADGRLHDYLQAWCAFFIKDVSLALYQFAADYVLERGIIIADTKFEFGLDETGKLTLMDEVLTPDSSRFWSKADYQDVACFSHCVNNRCTCLYLSAVSCTILSGRGGAGGVLSQSNVSK
jgi:hypothetical protein